MLSLEQRRKLAIRAGLRLETVTAIFSRRRRCGQRHALLLANAAMSEGIRGVHVSDLAMNQYSRARCFTGEPKKL